MLPDGIQSVPQPRCGSKKLEVLAGAEDFGQSLHYDWLRFAHENS